MSEKLPDWLANAIVVGFILFFAWALSSNYFGF